MPKISENHYHQGRAIYDGGGTVRQMIETFDQMEAQTEAAHAALSQTEDPARIDYSDKHRDISEAHRDALPSIVAGFLDGFLVDIRRTSRRGGQTA